jgi:hypothetical protein
MFNHLEELLTSNDEAAVQFAEEHMDEITDELVAALEDAFRILRADLLGLTFH